MSVCHWWLIKSCRFGINEQHEATEETKGHVEPMNSGYWTNTRASLRNIFSVLISQFNMLLITSRCNKDPIIGWKFSQLSYVFPPDQHNRAIVAFHSCVPNMTDSDFNMLKLLSLVF